MEKKVNPGRSHSGPFHEPPVPPKTEPFTLKQNTEWRERLTAWSAADKTTLENVIYQLVLERAKAVDVAELFNQPESDIRELFPDILTMAHAELRIKIFGDTIRKALGTKIANYSIWAGKSFAGMTNEPLIQVARDTDIEMRVTMVGAVPRQEREKEADHETPENDPEAEG